MAVEQVKALFRQRGITFTRRVEGNDYSRNEIYRVLSGQTKARYGKPREIIMKLRLKSAAQVARRF